MVKSNNLDTALAELTLQRKLSGVRGGERLNGSHQSGVTPLNAAKLLRDAQRLKIESKVSFSLLQRRL